MKKPCKKKEKSKQCYVIFSAATNYKYGAFPLSEDGKEKAKEYIKKLSKSNKDKFIIVKQ